MQDVTIKPNFNKNLLISHSILFLKETEEREKIVLSKIANLNKELDLKGQKIAKLSEIISFQNKEITEKNEKVAEFSKLTDLDNQMKTFEESRDLVQNLEKIPNENTFPTCFDTSFEKTVIEVSEQNKSSKIKIEQLEKDKSELKHMNDILKTQLEEAVEDKQNYEKIMARERHQFKKEQTFWKIQHDEMKIDFDTKLKHELKAKEKLLRAYFISQMESIVDKR